jgi:hypothetical protein
VVVRTFSREIASDKTPDEVMAETVPTITVPLARHGYTIQLQTDRSLIYACTYHAWWTWALIVLTFPIGSLVFYLFLRDTAAISLSLRPNGGGTIMQVSGEGSKKVRQAFETMQF